MQSELLPSACMVELPSKPHLGRSASVGGFSNCLRRVLPRSSGTGCFPSSQIYSSLYFVIVFEGSPDLRRHNSCASGYSLPLLLYCEAPRGTTGPNLE